MGLRAFRRWLTCSTVFLLSVPVTALSTASLAQEAQADSQDGTLLDTIVITARKRSEVEEKAPVSATVVKPEQMPPSSLDPGAEISRQSPNTNFIDYTRFGENFLNMRGISTLGSPLNSFDSTVGFSIDGVPTSVSGFAPPLLDVEQVEVLRGPQGTTFGRNALAGSINVVNRVADGVRGYRIDGEIGENGHAFAQVTGGGWVVPDLLAARGAVRLQKYDGDIRNPYLGEDLGDASIGAGRGTVRYTPGDNWTIDVTGTYSRDKRANPAYVLFDHPDFPISGEDVKPENLRKIAQGTVNIRKDLDKVSFVSTTSYQDIKIKNYGDFTDAYFYGGYLGVPPQFMFDPTTDKILTDEKEGLFTQEFRLNSAEGAPLQWVVGTSYLHSSYDFHREAGTNYFPTLNGTFDNELKSQTYAVFGDATVPLGEHWKVSGGLRLAHDRQSFEGDYVTNGFPGTLPFFHQEGDVSDTYLTGRAALAYEWTRDVMSYGSIARGYSSGGFEKSAQYAPFGIASPPFEPAKGWTYELGTKANIGERATVRAAVFYNDITDGQLSGFDLSTFQVFMTNQDFRSYGFEIGGTLEVAEGLQLSGGLGYTESEMVNVTAQSELAGAREGNQVPQVPEWTGNLGLGYQLPGETFGLGGNFNTAVSYQYVGSRYADLANREEMEEYHMINSKLGWENDSVGFYGFANNLLDERPLSYSLTLAPDVRGVYVGRGRVLGVGASIKF